MTELAPPPVTTDIEAPLLASADETAGLQVESMSPGRRAFRRFLRHRVAVFSLVTLGVISIVILLAPLTTRFGEAQRLPAIGGRTNFAPPGATAWLGTDDLNRDIYSRIVWGGRVSILIGLATALISSVVGMAIGSLAGYRGGKIDTALMRTTDIFLSFPFLVALLVLRNMFAAVHGLKFLFGDLKSIRFIVVLLSLFGWMAVARIVRGAVLSLKEREFVEASRALGAKTSRIIVRHILPNTIGPLLAATTLAVVGAVSAETTLSFFGYGLDPSKGKASWGNLLSDAKGAVITGKWWMVVFPSAVFVLTMLCINFIGDGLRDAFDPKQDKGRA